VIAEYCEGTPVFGGGVAAAVANDQTAPVVEPLLFLASTCQ